MRGFAAVLLLATIATVQSSTIDEIIADANAYAKNVKTEEPVPARHPGEYDDGDVDGGTLVDGGKAKLFQLDMAQSLRCRKLNGKPPSGVTLKEKPSSNDCQGKTSARRKKRNISVWDDKWGTKTIPYVWDKTNFTASEIAMVEAAFEEYEKWTCIKFIERTDETERYFEIIRDGGCWSYVGYYAELDPQPLSLAIGCAENKATPIHELFHLLGSGHHMNRHDRDRHVTVMEDRIQEKFLSQYEVMPREEAKLFGTEYSYRSVMHYGQYFFAKDRSLPAMITKDKKYQEIIGNAPTFSFVDLQVIHKYYKCYDQACDNKQCLRHEYLGKDCNCHCKNDERDQERPAGICRREKECTKADEPCNCTVNGCQGVENSICNEDTGGCECDATGTPKYYANRGKCVVPRDVSCRRVGVDCLCSHKGVNACNKVTGTATCDTETDQCKCAAGFQEFNGRCKVANKCNRLSMKCGCSNRPSGSCASKLRQSECNERTDKCECKPGFIPAARDACRKDPGCDIRPNRDCQCHTRGEGACVHSGTTCDGRNGKCQCQPGHFTKNPWKRCVPSCYPAIFNDGQSIKPFRQHTSNPVKFVVEAGSDPGARDMCGLKPNGYVLTASSFDSDEWASLSAPKLAPADVRNVNICVQITAYLSNVLLSIQYRYDGSSWSSIDYNGGEYWGLIIEKFENVEQPSLMQFRFKASALEEGSSWFIAADPFIIRNCDCTDNPSYCQD